LTGTHQGEFIGFPATGRRFSVTGMSLDLLANGQIKAGFDSWDALGLRRQLAANPDSASNED
jgi:predicted ester cyclase